MRQVLDTKYHLYGVKKSSLSEEPQRDDSNVDDIWDMYSHEGNNVSSSSNSSLEIEYYV